MTAKWEAPTPAKEVVEFRMLVAELDHQKYVRVIEYTLNNKQWATEGK
ncbi:hypothetical protein AB7828_29565 [Tardiphaga sp. 215_C5_N2_1]